MAKKQTSHKSVFGKTVKPQGKSTLPESKVYSKANVPFPQDSPVLDFTIGGPHTKPKAWSTAHRQDDVTTR